MCFLQIATVKSQVGLEMFRKNVLRKFWSLGEEFSIDGKLIKKMRKYREANKV